MAYDGDSTNLKLGDAKTSKENLKKRIHSLESGIYTYEMSKGKGTWRKDNPRAAKLLDSLLKEEIAMTVKEVESEMGEEQKASKGANREGPETDSKATGSMAGTTKGTSESYTSTSPKPVKYGF